MNRRGFLGAILAAAAAPAIVRASSLMPVVARAGWTITQGVDPLTGAAVIIDYRRLAREQLARWATAMWDQATYNTFAPRLIGEWTADARSPILTRSFSGDVTP